MFTKPVFLNRNRVFRVYLGGKLFSSFFGDEPIDSNLPEEWVASCVKALNKESSGSNEGLSIVEGTDISLIDLINSNIKSSLGERDKFDVLVKVLDSAIRLPAQAHPDREFSQKHFGTTYGKAESWLILDTREDACVYFGFKEGITKEEFQKAIKQSDDDKDIMQTLMNRIPVKKGDIFFVPPKMIHAIGAGCLLLEVQEPTDFTIQPERWCGDYRLSNSEMYLNLSIEDALDCFDYSVYAEKSVSMAQISPSVTFKNESLVSEELIGGKQTSCFKVIRHSLSGGKVKLSSAPAVYAVVDGNGEIYGENYSRKVKKGDYFFYPHDAKDKFNAKSDNTMQIVECLPPEK